MKTAALPSAITGVYKDLKLTYNGETKSVIPQLIPLVISWAKRLILQFTLLLGTMLLSVAAFGQTTLATYSFENNLNPQPGTFGSPTLTLSSLSLGNSSVCQGSYNLSSSTIGAYVELTISTIGFTNIGVTWIGRRSSTSGTSWLLTANSGSGYGSTLYTQTNTTSCVTIPVYTLGSDFNNNSSIQIRITLSRTAGTAYLDQMVITGTCIPSVAPTSITGTSTICNGSSTTLSTSGGSLGVDAADVWYQGACVTEAFTQEWQTQPYTVYNTTVNSVTNGILNVT